MNDIRDLHSLAAGYVVDALDPDETREFERHLAGCDACRREVAELREVTAALAQSVAAEPTPALRGSILDAIAETPQDSGATAELDSGAAAALDSKPAAAPDTSPHRTGSSVTPLRASREPRHVDARPRRTRRWTGALVAASVLAAVGLGGWAWQSQQELDDTRQESELVAADNARLTELLAADDVQTVQGEFASGGEGVVVLSRSEDSAVLLGRDLADLPDDEVYQAWLIAGDDAPVSAGTFTPEDNRSLVELPRQAVDVDTVAVTAEPEGGSEQPTTDILFAVELPKA